MNRTTKGRGGLIACTALAICLVIGAPRPARAQLAVIDLKSLTQLTQQLAQAKAQVALLQQQVQSIGADVTAPLAGISAQATSLLRQAQGIGYATTNLESQFTSLNPTNLASLQQINASLQSWQAQSRSTLQDAMQLQNQVVLSQPTTASAVSGAVAASQGAAGPTAAAQATNQLLAVVSTQLGQLQNLQAAYARAAETAAAQQQAAVAAAQADQARRYAPPTYTPRFSKDSL